MHITQNLVTTRHQQIMNGKRQNGGNRNDELHGREREKETKESGEGVTFDGKRPRDGGKQGRNAEIRGPRPCDLKATKGIEVKTILEVIEMGHLTLGSSTLSSLGSASSFTCTEPNAIALDIIHHAHSRASGRGVATADWKSDPTDTTQAREIR
eukprot:scaffold28550_cov35-Tisochrysis_lutea.AAC.2